MMMSTNKPRRGVADCVCVSQGPRSTCQEGSSLGLPSQCSAPLRILCTVCLLIEFRPHCHCHDRTGRGCRDRNVLHLFLRSFPQLVSLSCMLRICSVSGDRPVSSEWSAVPPGRMGAHIVAASASVSAVPSTHGAHSVLSDPAKVPESHRMHGVVGSASVSAQPG